MTSTAFTDSISAVSPLSRRGVDGSARPKARTRKTPAEKGVYEGWICPRPECGEEVPAKDSGRHLIAHMNALDEDNRGLRQQAAALGPEGVRTEIDGLGNVLIFGPANAAANPAVWLQWKDIVIDAAVQRDIEPNHPLLRRGNAALSYDKTEAITVAPVYVPGDDGSFVLGGYRAVNGQHRVTKGKREDPDGWQLCKLVSDSVESRQGESVLARTMSHAQSPFKASHDWHSLRREGHPNVAAAGALLDRMGYLVTTQSASSSQKAIAGAGALLAIIGVPDPSGTEPAVTKDPQEAARDLSEVLQVIEGIQRTEREGNRRYGAMMLKLVYSIIDDNRDIIEVGRLAQAMSTHTIGEWLKFAADKEMGGRKYLRERIVREYNKNKRKDLIS